MQSPIVPAPAGGVGSLISSPRGWRKAPCAATGCARFFRA